MKIGAVVLAGGEGRRIGGGKPQRLLAGKALFDHVLDRARSWGVPIAISVREPDAWSGQFDFVLVDGSEAGPIAGIASALRFARAQGLDAVLTLPCDTPFLPADLPMRLIVALEPPALAAVATSGGRAHPTCALWTAAAAAALPAYIAQGSSLTGFSRCLKARTAEWRIDPIDPFFNVNTPADLAWAEEAIKRR